MTTSYSSACNYIPPLMITENEAIAMIIGSRLLMLQAAGSITIGAHEATTKITVALPDQVRVKAEALTNIK